MNVHDVPKPTTERKTCPSIVNVETLSTENPQNQLKKLSTPSHTR